MTSSAASPTGAVRRVAVTGATGFLGAALVPLLREQGCTVLRVTRRPSGPDDVRWDPRRGEIDGARLEGVDAVIHLAGENVAQRWTDESRRRIRDSRVKGTTLIARTIANLATRPRVLVSVSGIGYYGDTGDGEVDETSPPGSGFLADLVRDWEAAANPARSAGIRVAHPRLGIVLDADGGALARLLPPFRLGLGGKIASGRQWMSWISRRDTVRALHWLLDTVRLGGPVNLVARAPVRNADFADTLASVLGRPAKMTVPAFALRAVYGDMADETLVAGQRVRCDRLCASGFTFEHPTLEDALRAAIGGS